MNVATKSILAVFVLAVIGGLFAWTSGGATDGGKWTAYGDALKKAEGSDRILVVDVYTNWCSWCKKMDRDVYGDPAVRAVLNQHFIAAKLNAESTTTHAVGGQSRSERDIAKSFGVTGYPTTLFLTAAGDPITVLPGYVPKETFLLVLEYIHTRSYERQSWEEFQNQKKS